MDPKSLRDEFINEYAGFYENGTLPSHSSLDFMYCLQKHGERLKEKNITIRRKFRSPSYGSDSSGHIDRPPYDVDFTYKEYGFDTEFLRNGKVIASTDKKINDIIYSYIVDKKQCVNERYTCPNCGYEDLMTVFGSGCPRCGTKFESRQTFPCVTGFYSIPKIADNRKIEQNMKTPVIAAAVTAGVIGIITALIAGAVNRSIAAAVIGFFISGILSFIFFAVIFWLIFSLVIVSRVAPRMASGIKDSMDLAATAKTKQKMEEEMRRFDKDFSYEMFEGRVISLLRAIAFSSDRDELSIYEGHDDLRYMDDIIDIEYRGAVRYNGYDQDGDMLRIKTVAFLICTYLKDSVMVRKKQTFEVDLARKTTADEDAGFTIHAVNCSTCGSSFDAMHIRNCPHCGSAYDLKDHSFIITGIRLLS